MKKSKTTLKFESDQLGNGEEVKLSAVGYVSKAVGYRKTEKNVGEVILTNKRLCHFYSGLLGKEFHSVNLEDIELIRKKGGMLYKKYEVITEVGLLEFAIPDKGEGEKILSAIDIGREQSTAVGVGASTRSTVVDRWVCKSCGFKTSSPKMRGHLWVEVLLWLCYIVPGIIYSIWRRNSGPDLCPSCDKSELVPANSSSVQNSAPASVEYEISDRVEIECPYCAELILKKAKKCKHCGEMVGPENVELV